MTHYHAALVRHWGSREAVARVHVCALGTGVARLIRPPWSILPAGTARLREPGVCVRHTGARVSSDGPGHRESMPANRESPSVSAVRRGLDTTVRLRQAGEMAVSGC